MNELRGEKIDVICWFLDFFIYIVNFFSLVRVDEVCLIDLEERRFYILVFED